MRSVHASLVRSRAVSIAVFLASLAASWFIPPPSVKVACLVAMLLSALAAVFPQRALGSWHRLFGLKQSSETDDRRIDRLGPAHIPRRGALDFSADGGLILNSFYKSLESVSTEIQVIADGFRQRAARLATAIDNKSESATRLREKAKALASWVIGRSGKLRGKTDVFARHSTEFRRFRAEQLAFVISYLPGRDRAETLRAIRRQAAGVAADVKVERERIAGCKALFAEFRKIAVSLDGAAGTLESILGDFDLLLVYVSGSCGTEISKIDAVKPSVADTGELPIG
jgi:hypothetical protein